MSRPLLAYSGPLRGLRTLMAALLVQQSADALALAVEGALLAALGDAS